MSGSIISTLKSMVNLQTPIAYARQRSGFALGIPWRNDMESQLAAMGGNGTLFAIVSRTSNATSQVNWRLWRKAASGKKEDRTEVTSHAALDLWNRPNPFYTRQELVETVQQHEELTGEGWLVFETDTRAPKFPIGLWPVRPDRMAPVPHATKFVAGYVYSGPDGEKVPLETWQVSQQRQPNPLDPYRGMGAVQAKLVDLDAARYTSQWNRNFFVNSAEPGGVIQVDKRLSDDEFEEMTARWREQHQGVANAHRVAVIEQGQWVDRKYTQRDMQFKELLELSSETIREAFGFPKPMLGTVEDVNRANADAAEVVFARWLLIPRLERWKGALNNDLLPLFPSAGDLEFDYDNPVPEDIEAENTALAAKGQFVLSMKNAGFYPPAVAEAVGLPDMVYGTPGADPDITTLTALVQGAPTLAPQLLPVIMPDKFPEPPAPPSPPPGPAPAPTAHVGRHRHRPSPRRPRNADDLSPRDLPDLSGVRELLEDRLARLLEDWDHLSAAQKAELVDLVRQIAEEGSLDDLATLSVDSAAAADALAAAMTEVAQAAADQVVDEADEQGVSLDPVWPSRDDVIHMATLTAALLATELCVSAARAAQRANSADATPDDIADAVRDYLDGLSNANAETQLGGALQGAINAGRTQTLAAGPVGAVYAHEMNDRNTCEPCRAVNGRWLGNTDDMETINKTYPDGAYGGYVGCLGGPRCRGTVFAVWREGTSE